MSDRTVIPSLAQVVRGLTLLFWAVPGMLLASTASAFDIGWRRFGYAPPVIAAATLVYGLIQFRHFQPQERIWGAARHRALLLAWVLLALSPLPIWWTRAPEETFFIHGMLVLGLTGPVFLIALNDVLLRLAAMLPDQTLRTETLFFTRLNTRLLVAILLGFLLWLGLPYWTKAPYPVVQLLQVLEMTRPWLFVMALLLPVALTMTLLWKTKEVILHSVFGR
ncbi:MAG TPA: hypothetical protein PLX89_21565 [Verrucomicrobiota bacterium]|nr:hypothetical protein [Verrucomicrobiota bacterium]